MVRLDEDNTSSAPVSARDGMVNQQLLLQNEYLLAENRILRVHLPNRLVLTDPERSTLAVIGKRLGHRGLVPVVSGARPDTILAWFVCWSRRNSMAHPAPPLSGSSAHRT
jgi:hypothetical protein